jgi:hypothetical protein
MAKPLLLSAGQGKVQEFVGISAGQVATWSETAEEWFAGPGVGGSGGGGEVFYFNFGNTGVSPTGTPLPQSTTSTPSTSPSLLGPTYNPTATSVESANLTNGNYSLVAGFLSASGSPGVLALPAGLWDFNIWAASTNAANATQCQIQVRVYIANAAGTQYGNASGATNGTPLAVSDAVYLYEQATIAQYILNVTIPQTTITATDRIYIEFWAQKNVNQTRTVTFSFATNQPSHVHTTIQVPVNLATDVTGTLPVTNGGTGVTTLTGYVKGNGTSDFGAVATIPVADVTGAAPLASPTFTGTVTIPAGASISGFAPLASPTFTGTPSLPTGTTGVTQSAGNDTTALATTAFVKTAVAAAGTPYDLPFEIPGTPALSTKVVNFDCVRPFILATTGHQGGQLTNPSGNFVCTVRKNSTTLGTITFSSGGFSSSITATLTDRTFAAGDVLSVETQSTALGIDTPHATLVMSLV